MIPSVWTVHGEQYTGKTSFTLSFPKKVRFWDFDWGYRRAYQSKQLESSGEVSVDHVILPARNLDKRDRMVIGSGAAWRAWHQDYDRCLLDPDYATLAVDTATFLWGLDCDGWLDELQSNPTRDGAVRQQLTPFDYGEPNKRMKILIQSAKQHGKNLVLVHHSTDEYAPVTVGGKPILDASGTAKTAATGKRIPDGFKYVRSLSDWVVRMSLEEYQEGEGMQAITKVRPVLRIEKSAEGLHLVGRDMVWPTFDKLEKLVEILVEA